ncbi:MAG: M13 family metallopeptidase [Bryobacteraceae bacterium]|nr:M13 family metallopeptidase [Bryobacteraceae bacterium]
MNLWKAALGVSIPLALWAASGIDRSTIDASCKPCDDFWRYANGAWMDKNPVPASKSSWGTMSVMAEANRERSRTILETARDSKAPAGSNERKIGDFYASCMDTAAIDQRGLVPLKKDLDRIAAIATAKDVAAVIVTLQGTVSGGGPGGGIGPVGLSGGPDLKNSKDIIANVGGSGLSLPDRDYYFKTDAKSVQIREAFLMYAAEMFVLLGDSPEAAAAAAKTIMAVETPLAEATKPRADRRDPYSRYHKMDFAALAALTPDFDWQPLFTNLGVKTTTAINVAEPDYLKKFNAQLTAVPAADWQTWLRWRLVSGAANNLSKPFADAAFRFNSGVLLGVKEQAPRHEFCGAVVDRMLGDALGEVWVRKHFPPAAKRRMNELVENLRATLREELQNAEWLAPETRKNAVAKLEAFAPKVGYPDRWRDYSSVKIDAKAYYENVRAASAFQRAYQLAKIGQPVNRNDWGMTPPTVNAYYSPSMNEIAFPAGILQPPLFDVNAGDELNYGAIGAVIGHEMGHGFDDQGSKFDAEGNLRNWWTAEDRQKFEARAGCVIEEFNTMDVGDGLRHNGRLVVGEAIGDLGGLTLAYRAWKRSLKGKPAPPVIDGFTADQRFFLAFARVWASQARPDALRFQLNTNPHPLAKFRTIGTLRSMPEFRAAFNCKRGDPMVRPEGQDCKLW